MGAVQPRPRVWRPVALFVGTLVGTVEGIVGGGCYAGAVPIGAFCDLDADCGPGQTCERNVCSRCGDGEVERGELCYGDASEKVVGGMVRVLVSEDLDDDGDRDIVALSNDDCGGALGECWWLRVLANDGSGQFDVGDSSPLPGTIDSVAIADFNENGAPDAALAVERGGVVLIALDIVDGVSGTSQLLVPGTDVHTVQVGDVDGDGHVDVLVAADAMIGMNSVHLFLGDGNGNVASERGFVAGPAARIAPPGDLDGDGDQDLVVTNVGLGEFAVFHNDGAGGFDEVQRGSTGTFPTFVTVADLDGDQNLDAIVTNSGANSVSFLRGSPGGIFAAPESLPVGDAPAFARIADLNVDGQPDVAVSNVATDKVSVYLGREGEFPDRVEFDVSAAPLWIDYADINGDDVGDLMIGAGGNVSVIRSEF